MLLHLPGQCIYFLAGNFSSYCIPVHLNFCRYIAKIYIRNLKAMTRKLCLFISTRGHTLVVYLLIKQMAINSLVTLFQAFVYHYIRQVVSAIILSLKPPLHHR